MYANTFVFERKNEYTGDFPRPNGGKAMFTSRIGTTGVAPLKVTTAALVRVGLDLTLSAAHAAEVATAPARVVLAVDTTPAPASTQVAPVARVIWIDANVASGLNVTAPKAAKVTLTTKGEKKRSKKITAITKPATFTTLTAGKTYTVFIDTKRLGTGTPVSRLGAAYHLTVTSTGSATSALLTWKYQDAPKAGVTAYDVSATPVAGQLSTVRSADLTRIITADSTGIFLTDLDQDLFYTFTVTPHNTATTGTASRATLPVTLGAAAGQLSSAEQEQVAQEAHAARGAAENEAAQKAANNPPAPTLGGPSAPGAPVKPRTKTIYLCPAGSSWVSTAAKESKVVPA